MALSTESSLLPPLPPLVIAAWLVYCVGIGVYRLYLSPLAKFPGPKLAALTGLYEWYFDLIKKGGGQFPFEIKRMHEKYGPIVRINPEELHVDDAEFADVLFSTSKPYDKPEYLQYRFSIPYATFSTARAAEHKVRRAALSPFFSRAKAREQNARVQAIMGRISQRLTTEWAGRQDKVLNVQHMWQCLAADVVMSLAYARPKDLHEAPDFRHPFTQAVDRVAVWCHITLRFGFLLTLLDALPNALAMRLFPPFRVVIEFRQEMRRQVEDVLAGRNEEAKKAGVKTVFHEMLSSGVPAHELRPVRLFHESQSLIGAGFETTAWVMTIGTFHVADNPAIYSRLREELAAAIPDPERIPSWAELEQLPYLTAVVCESLRVAFGAVERLPRINRHGIWTYVEKSSGKDGQEKKVWAIPAGTPVGMDAFHMHLDTRVWGSDAAEFRPERWLGDPRGPDGVKPLSAYLNTFARGTRMCLGMNLASVEMYVGFATLFRRHELRLFETTRRDVEFYRENVKAVPWPGSKGVRFLVVS